MRLLNPKKKGLEITMGATATTKPDYLFNLRNHFYRRNGGYGYVKKGGGGVMEIEEIEKEAMEFEK